VYQLVDDGDEVVETANRLELVGIGAEGSASQREHEGVVHDVEIDSAAVEGECGATVLPEDPPQGSWQLHVLLEDVGDVARLSVHLRDLGESGLDVVRGDDPAAGECGGEERVVCEEIELARESAGGLEERLVGGWLEEGQFGAGMA
jgi:hypothetical protein